MPAGAGAAVQDLGRCRFWGKKKKNIHGWRLLWQCPAAVCLLCPAPRSPLGTAVQLDAGTEPAAGVCLQ